MVEKLNSLCFRLKLLLQIKRLVINLTSSYLEIVDNLMITLICLIGKFNFLWENYVK